MTQNSRYRYMNGYRLVYSPHSYRAMHGKGWEGYVYEHIIVAESMLKRTISDDEVVHHLDGNRANNRFENLLVLTRAQHTKLHMWLRAGAPGSDKFVKTDKDPCSTYKADQNKCAVCGGTLQKQQSKTCSRSCASFLSRRAIWPSKEELIILLNDKSRVSIGKMFGVSDSAVKKWAIKYGIL